MFYSFPGPRKSQAYQGYSLERDQMTGIQIPKVGCKRSFWGCTFILHSHRNYKICLRVGPVLSGSNQHRECNHMKHLGIKNVFFFIFWSEARVHGLFLTLIYSYMLRIYIVFIGVFKTRHKGNFLILAPTFFWKKKSECRTEYLQIHKFIP